MKLVDNFSSDINHAMLGIIDSETRRHILQLIATETNYGNRLASILNLSSPAIHRHLKRLEHFENDDEVIEILSTKRTTRKSYSGHKGAKATIYEITANMGLFFGIFPNFIHSQVVELDKSGDVIARKIDPDNFDPDLFGVKIQNGEEITECSGDDCFTNHILKIQQLNNQIKEYQEYLMNMLYMKNEVIDNIFRIIEKAKDLTFQERVVLKSLIAYGFNNLKLIAKLLNTDENDVHFIIRSLRRKEWIVDKEIIRINKKDIV